MVNELSARSPSPPRLLTSPRDAIHGPLLRSLAWNQEWGFTFPDRALRRHAVQCPFSEACWISELREASMRDHATPFGFRDFLGCVNGALAGAMNRCELSREFMISGRSYPLQADPEVLPTRAGRLKAALVAAFPRSGPARR
jgi:hypothetical protein